MQMNPICGLCRQRFCRVDDGLMGRECMVFRNVPFVLEM